MPEAELADESEQKKDPESPAAALETEDVLLSSGAGGAQELELFRSIERATEIRSRPVWSRPQEAGPKERSSAIPASGLQDE